MPPSLYQVKRMNTGGVVGVWVPFVMLNCDDQWGIWRGTSQLIFPAGIKFCWNPHRQRWFWPKVAGIHLVRTDAHVSRTELWQHGNVGAWPMDRSGVKDEVKAGENSCGVNSVVKGGFPYWGNDCGVNSGVEAEVNGGVNDRGNKCGTEFRYGTEFRWNPHRRRWLRSWGMPWATDEAWTMAWMSVSMIVKIFHLWGLGCGLPSWEGWPLT